MCKHNPRVLLADSGSFIMREQKHLQRTGSQLSCIALQKNLKYLGVAMQQFNLSDARRPKAPIPLKKPKMTNGLHIYINHLQCIRFGGFLLIAEVTTCGSKTQKPATAGVMGIRINVIQEPASLNIQAKAGLQCNNSANK